MSVRCLLLSVALLTACGSDDFVDRDGDGIRRARDCNDKDPTVGPGMEDLVGDDIDQNCDGLDGVDGDGDGVASAESGGLDCVDADPDTRGVDQDADGFPACVDCNDEDGSVSPAAEELCDGVDRDCSGTVDADAEGVGVCVLQRPVSDALDLLFVVDNSCSMSEEQGALVDTALAFKAELDQTGLDYHLGVVTTDPSELGVLVPVFGSRWVDAAEPDGDAMLEELVLRGVGGSANESGLDMAVAALVDQMVAPAGTNIGFVRAAATLHVVFFSDEDDHSGVGPAQVLQAVSQEKGAVLPPTFHSIVSGNPVCVPGGAEPGDTYVALAELSGGMVADICTPPWTPLFQDIVDGQLALGPTDTFPVGLAVDPTTLEVEHLALDGYQIGVYGAEEVLWDAAAMTVALPVEVQAGEWVSIRYAAP